MKTLFKWFFCLSKRLYKKWMFVILICLIPLSAAALKYASAGSKGFVQIAVVNHALDTGEKIIENLTADKGLINFIVYGDDQSALNDLKQDVLDSVWILPEDIETHITAFVADHDSGNHPIISVINKADNLKTRMAVEKLSGAIFPIISRQFFLKCVREDTDFDLSHMSDREIYDYYDKFFNNANLFEFAFPEDNIPAKTGERDYLTSPVRGLLSVITLLSGLAASMLYISDNKKGVFSFTGNSKRIFIAFAFVLTAIVNIGVFAFASVFVLGVNTSFLREAAIFLIFTVNTALFCTLLMQVIKSNTFFSPAAVLLAVLDILICPIFFDYTVQRIPQFIFPNAYYINSVHSNTYLKYSLIYTGVLILLLIPFYLKKRRRT